MNEKSNKMSEEEFVINAIKKLRKPPYKGIHSVFSGFNAAFEEYFCKNPIDVTQRLAKEGKIIIRPVKGGVMLYLPGDFQKIPKPDEIIKKIVGENEVSEGQTVIKEEKDYERPIKEMMTSLGLEKTSISKIARVCGAIPQKEYRIPILEALFEMSGKGTQKEVFEIIEEKMKDRFNDLDLEILKDGRSVRWQKMAAWERYSMIKEGLLRSDSPQGIWEITEKGREYLKMFKNRL